MKRFNHSLNLALAPVIVIIDDQGDPINLTILGPLSLLIWFPCWLASVNWLAWFSPAQWLADVSIIAQALNPAYWLPIPMGGIG